MPEPYFFWGGFCSQWHRSPFEIDGVTYRTAEHWMMASKAVLFDDEAALADVLATKDPRDVKAIGRRIKGWNEDVWKRHRFQIVCRGNYEKFRQNADLRDELLWISPDREIIEASPHDKVWGIGLGEDEARAFWQEWSIKGQEPVITWPGTNLLGEAIMAARTLLIPR